MKVARTVLNGESGSNAADLHNDTIYRLNADLISAKCILKYDDKYLLYKNEYIERSYTERMTVNDAEEACNKGKFPQLITYFSCDSVHLLFMRMNGFLSGFYYPDTKRIQRGIFFGKNSYRE